MDESRQQRRARERAQRDWEASGKKLGDGPIEAKYHAEMKAIVQALDECFNGKVGGPDRKTGFVLMVFPFGDTTGRCNYASNGAAREDIVVLMKAMIARFEGQPEVSGTA